jgi:hypothetical protein
MSLIYDACYWCKRAGNWRVELLFVLSLRTELIIWATASFVENYVGSFVPVNLKSECDRNFVITENKRFPRN